MMVVDDIDGFVLAGGASSRMGRPKGGLILGGSSLVDRAASTMSRVTGKRVTVVGDEISSEACTTQFTTIPDLVSGPEGRDRERRASIYGLFTALGVATTEWIAVLAVDLPFVSGELLDRLLSMRSEGTDALVPIQADGRLQPLCALYRRDVCFDAARIAIETGELSLHRLIGGLRVRRVESAEVADLPGSENFFFNVNTPEDLQVAAKLRETNGVVL